MHSFIHAFIHSFIHSFIQLFIHSLILNHRPIDQYSFVHKQNDIGLAYRI